MAKYELSLTVNSANADVLTLGSDTLVLDITPQAPVSLSVLELLGPRGEAGAQGPAGPAGTTTFAGLTDVSNTDTATAGQLLQADGDNTFSFVTVTGATNTLDDITTNGNTTTNDISVGGITATSLNTHTIPSGTGTLAKTSDIPTDNNQLTNGAGYITDYTVTESDVTAHEAALSITESQISDLGTYATLVNGTVPASQLPSYVDDVEEYTNYASFPATGETGKIYVDLATGDIYRWSGSAYVQINDAVSSADQATRLATARDIALSGDVTGSASFDGSADITITATVADDSHNHIISNVDGLQTALDGKLDDTATTDDVSEGSTNLYYTSARFDTAFGAKDTDNLSEGATNLYYTDARADARVNLQTGTNLDLSSKDTDDLSEGSTNLYYTDARANSAFDTRLATKDTDDLSEGTTNLYYTDTRANAAIDARVDEDFINALNVDAASADTLTFTVKNSTGSTLEKGSVVYVSGLNGNTPEVSLARANSSSTMPAFGLVTADIADNNDGTVDTFGSLRGLNVADFGETGITFSLGDTVYVSSSEAGKLTNVAPSGEANLIQNIGKIERATPTTNMTIKVGGAGRTNATPNLDNGNIFIGDSNNRSVTSDLDSEVRSRVSATDAGGDGSFSYNSGTGVFTYTGPSASEVRAHLSAGGDLSYDSNTGIISFTERTDAEVRQLFSVSGDLSYNNSTGVFSFTERTDSEVRGLVSASGDLSYNHTTGVFSFTERTDAEVRGLVSATFSGGDGGFSYDNSTGVFTYTGPSAAETRAHFTGGTGVTITNGEVAIGQAVGTTDNVQFGNATLSGYLAGPATFTIDPSAVGDNTGKVVIAGDLQVDGTTTTVNSTTVEVADKNIVLGADATADSQNNGAGITVSRPDVGSSDAIISWDETNGEWDITNGLNVAGNILLDGTVDGRDLDTDGTKLDGIEDNADVTDTTNVVAALTAGTNITIAGDGTISSTDTNTEYTAGDGLSLTGTDFDVDLTDTTIFADDGTSSRAVKTSSTGVIQDGKGDVRDIPQNAKTAAYSLLAADAGKHISITTGGVTVASSQFTTGDAVTIYNNSGSSQTITQGSGVTLRSAGSSDTGNRTLAQYGLCTLICVGTETFVISGVGLS